MVDQQNATNSGIIQQIEQLLANHEYLNALNLCVTIQFEEPLPRKFWFLKARALANLGEKAQALEAYRCEIASVKRVPPDLLSQIGLLLIEIGQYHRAVVCLAESCEISQSADNLVLLASALFHLGRSEEAKATVKKAIDIDPKNDEAWHNLGAYTLAESANDAEFAFKRALELDPNRPDSCGGLALAYLAQKQIQSAIATAKIGIQQNPLCGICHQALAEGLEQLGDLVDAQKAYLTAFHCDYDKILALLGLARILEQRGFSEDATEWYRRGLHAWPDDSRVRVAYLDFSQNHKLDDNEMTMLCRHIMQIENSLSSQKG